MVGCSQFMGGVGEACHSVLACTSVFASSVGNLIVGLKETDSSPILPLDSAADSGCRHSGASNTQSSCSGNGNAQSGARTRLHTLESRAFLICRQVSMTTS